MSTQPTQGENPEVVALLEEASTRADLWDWGADMEFTEPLRLFVESSHRTGSLNAVGRDVLHKVVTRHLRNRLAIRAFVKGYPEVEAMPVRRPLFITGLPRTGTTLLHNLMAADPANRVLRFWQALRVCEPSTGAAGCAEETLVAEAELWLERLYALAPYFRAIHPSTATGPEECDALFQNCFASQHFDDMFRADDYSAWLAGASLRAEYDYYRTQLRALELQSRARDLDQGAERRWVLKSPSHLGYLGSLFDAFPDATVAFCHRDPNEAVGSYASLVLNVRQPYSDDVVPDEVGAHALRRCTVAMRRALDTRDAVGEERFVDVSYPALVDDPIGVVRGIYERIGRTLGDAEQEAMRGWLADNPRHRHGAHRYGLSQFGLTAETVADGLGAYLDRFGAELTAR
ncbi:MAG: sulfotransferase [Actinomycetota bacterium]|nr:sulfotransferase [Actinomycetota bacterium]